MKINVQVVNLMANDLKNAKKLAIQYNDISYGI